MKKFILQIILIIGSILCLRISSEVTATTIGLSVFVLMTSWAVSHQIKNKQLLFTDVNFGVRKYILLFVLSMGGLALTFKNPNHLEFILGLLTFMGAYGWFLFSKQTFALKIEKWKCSIISFLPTKDLSQQKE